jgi:hypothetical protein
MGAITIPVVYATMRESGYPIAIAVFSASLILFGMSSSNNRGDKLTGRQRARHSDPTDPTRRRIGPIHVSLGPLLCQIPPAAIPRVHADMVVLATSDRNVVGMYAWLQDGWPVHFYEYRSCCLV